jgi:hypothetical protein
VRASFNSHHPAMCPHRIRQAAHQVLRVRLTHPQRITHIRHTHHDVSTMDSDGDMTATRDRTLDPPAHKLPTTTTVATMRGGSDTL